MSTSTTSFPTESLQLLRRLAEHHGQTSGAFFTRLVREQAALAKIDDNAAPVMTGLDVKAGRIQATFRGNVVMLTLSGAEALSVAETLERVADFGGPRVALNLDVEPSVEVSRRGTGVIVEYASRKSTLSRNEAREAVASLRTVAAMVPN